MHGKGEFVEGLVLKLKGANANTTVIGIKKEMEAIKKALPEGVKIVPFYDRSELVNSAIWTVQKALAQAIVLVIVVLFAFLGNLRSAVSVVIILPLAVLFTFILMRYFGTTANLMSLGGLAIAIGILVDAAVVVVENVQTHLSRGLRGRDRLHIVYRATVEVAQPVISGTVIIITVFLPLFSLSGLEGKMFTPLAITISFALIGSLVLSLTVIPVAASYLMKAGGGGDNYFLRKLKDIYRPVLNASLQYRAFVVAFALIGIMGAGWLYTQIGMEFMPTLDEGTTVVIVEKLPSISLKRSLEIDGDIQRAFMTLPDVIGVAARMGTDELKLDPMGLYQTDNFILTKPRSEWTVDGPKELEIELRKILDRFPGIVYGFTQPIDMRVSEMLTGVRAAVAVKLSGDDLEVLDEKSRLIETLLKNIPGSVDVFRSPIFGQSYLNIEMHPGAMSRYGVNVEDINELIGTAVGGRVVTEVIEGNRRTAVLLRYPEAMRNSAQAIGDIQVRTPSGNRIPIKAMAAIVEKDGPVQITREAGMRQVVIQSNVEGRDIVGFVEEARQTINKQVTLPSGYSVKFGGQFENQQRAFKRLTIVIPVAIFLIFLLLFTTFNSIRQALLVLLNIPCAMIGGIISLYLSGLYLSVPASVGFIALFGIAIMNGIVMVTYFNQLRKANVPLVEAVKQGAERRLRPVLMTAITTGLGLVPLMLATGPGSEIQKPLAIVVMGGLFTATLLTLVLLPTLYVQVERRTEKQLEVLK